MVLINHSNFKGKLRKREEFATFLQSPLSSTVSAFVSVPSKNQLRLLHHWLPLHRLGYLQPHQCADGGGDLQMRNHLAGISFPSYARADDEQGHFAHLRRCAAMRFVGPGVRTFFMPE